MDEDYELIIKQIIKHIYDKLIELGIPAHSITVSRGVQISWISPKGSYTRRLWLDEEANIKFQCDSFTKKLYNQTFDIRDPQSIQKAIDTFCN